MGSLSLHRYIYENGYGRCNKWGLEDADVPLAAWVYDFNGIFETLALWWQFRSEGCLIAVCFFFCLLFRLYNLVEVFLNIYILLTFSVYVHTIILINAEASVKLFSHRGIRYIHTSSCVASFSHSETKIDPLLYIHIYIYEYQWWRPANWFLSRSRGSKSGISAFLPLPHFSLFLSLSRAIFSRERGVLYIDIMLRKSRISLRW